MLPAVVGARRPGMALPRSSGPTPREDEENVPIGGISAFAFQGTNAVRFAVRCAAAFLSIRPRLLILAPPRPLPPSP